MSPEHVLALSAVGGDIPREALGAGVDDLLAAQARLYCPAAFRRAAIRIRDHVNPAAADGGRPSGHDKPWLHLSKTLDGTWSISGMLDAVGGESLHDALSALMPAPVVGEVRPPSERRADALVDLCRAAAAHVPTASGEKPHVSVIVDLETLRGAGESPPLDAGPPDAGPPDAGPAISAPGAENPPRLARTLSGTFVGTVIGTLFGPGGRWRGATLGSGTPVPPEVARRLACDAKIIPVVLGSSSQPLDIGRATRVPSEAIRRAVILRDGTCRWPGCDRPAAWTDLHHIQHWSAGGPTCIANLILLCRRHHGRVHEDGWYIRLDATSGNVHVTKPCGTPLDLISRPRGMSP